MKKTKFSKIISNFDKSRIMVLGDVMLDRYLWGDVERISPEAPVPVVNVAKETDNLGGAANVAACVKALGAKVVLVGIIGDDRFGEIFKRSLSREKISISGLIKDTKRPTTVKTRIVAHNQQVVRIDRELSSEIKDELVEEIIKRVKNQVSELDGIIISDYGKGVITENLLAELIPIALSNNVFISVDPKEVHFKNYKKVSVITPNHHEAGFIAGRKIKNTKILSDVGWSILDDLDLESLLITLGSKGMGLFEKDGSLTLIPAEAKQVYDVTGAGDTVIATLTVAKTAGASMKDAAFISNIAAGISVGKIGTVRVLREELMEALSSR